MKYPKDLTGIKFGKLTVLKYAGKDNYYCTLWLCKCDCGKEKVIKRSKLVTGHTKSCGCTNRERIIKLNTTHGLSNTKIYYIWQGMKSRCLNPNVESYKYFGANKISICEDWISNFQAFYEWSMKNGYKDGLSIDRIDVNGNYCPENCRWVDMKKQGRNRRNNHLLTYNNETHCISEWADILAIEYNKLKNEIRKTNNLEKALINLKIIT